MRTLVFLSLILVLAGCDKKTDVFVFDCVVYDEKVDAPVSGASVILKVQYAAGGFNPNFETVGLAVTSASGRFYIEVDKDIYYSYRFEVTHPTYFSGTFDVNPDNVPFSTAYSSTFNLEPKSWVSTHIVNQNSSQAVTFKVEAETAGCANCCSSTNTILQGLSVDTTFTCQIYGQQQIEVNGNYLDENGGVHQIAETAFVAAFDTVLVTIIY
jgi:hypothetical protein